MSAASWSCGGKAQEAKQEVHWRMTSILLMLYLFIEHITKSTIQTSNKEEEEWNSYINHSLFINNLHLHYSVIHQKDGYFRWHQDGASGGQLRTTWVINPPAPGRAQWDWEGAHGWRGNTRLCASWRENPDKSRSNWTLKTDEWLDSVDENTRWQGFFSRSFVCVSKLGQRALRVLDCPATAMMIFFLVLMFWPGLFPFTRAPWP